MLLLVNYSGNFPFNSKWDPILLNTVVYNKFAPFGAANKVISGRILGKFFKGADSVGSSLFSLFPLFYCLECRCYMRKSWVVPLLFQDVSRVLKKWQQKDPQSWWWWVATMPSHARHLWTLLLFYDFCCRKLKVQPKFR